MSNSVSFSNLTIEMHDAHLYHWKFSILPLEFFYCAMHKYRNWERMKVELHSMFLLYFVRFTARLLHLRAHFKTRFFFLFFFAALTKLMANGKRSTNQRIMDEVSLHFILLFFSFLPPHFFPSPSFGLIRLRGFYAYTIT